VPRWADRWIVVANWSRFQSRHERPGAPWIKLYRSLLHKTEWRDLAPADQALLVNVWLMYAEEDGRLRVADAIRWAPVDGNLIRTRSAGKRHHERITRGLDRLNRAGFVVFSDDKPLPLSLNPLDARARTNGNGPRTPPCPECEVGGGLHAAGCSRAEVQS
jgi:hypothetical protein